MMHRVICPRCTTVFRVTPAQMNMRAGQLRCGRCQEVFNGWHYLEDPPSEGLASNYPENLESQQESEQPNLANEKTEIEPFSETDSPNVLLPEILRPPKSSKYTRPFWILVAITAFLALLFQGALFWSTSLNVNFPLMRPVLALICNMGGVKLELPRVASLISLDSSELRSDTQSGIYTLDAIIANHSSFPQQYPLMELSLTDVHNSIIARRVLSPSLYLGSKGDPSLGIPAHSEVDVHLPLKISGVVANGYHVYIFYAAKK